MVCTECGYETGAAEYRDEINAWQERVCALYQPEPPGSGRNR